MKTDTLFYELFRIEPRSLFDLVQLNIKGEYVFESITVKHSEKRFDGFLKRTDGTGPNIFLEVQGYDDPKIYWRLFREICTWYEQTETEVPFVAIVIFIDKKYKPEKCPLSCVRPDKIICITLEESLEKLHDKAGVLTVLKPFGLSDKKELSESAARWTAEIQSLKIPDYQREKLIELLEYVIIQCFPKLTLKEIQTMIRLTPLEKTVAGQELIQIGIKEGIKEAALNMLKMGIDVKIICQATGLTDKDIKQLRKLSGIKE